MRHLLFGLTVVGIVTSCGFQTASAQQQQRRSVTIVFRQASVEKTQWSSDAGNPISSSPNGQTQPGNQMPGMLPASSATPAVSANGFSFEPNNGVGPNDFSQRPTVQQLQNPSASFQMTHLGFSQDQYTSTNNYFGSQYNSWSNIRPVPTNLSSFESFNRYQPPINSGGYVTANSYIGPVNNQWSNLSSGFVTPNYIGGWTYQQQFP